MDLKAWKILLDGMEADGTSCTTASREYGHGNAVEVETGIFLYGLVRRYQPANILETGCHWGYSSAWMAMGLKDNRFFYPNKKANALITLDMTAYDGKPEALWEKVGVSEFIFHLIKNSEDPESYNGIHPPECIELFWQDADHSAEAIVREFDAAAHLLSRERCIIGYHDTSLDRRMNAGVIEIIQKLIYMRENRVGWQFISHVPMRNMRGLDLIYLSQEWPYPQGGVKKA